MIARLRSWVKRVLPDGVQRLLAPVARGLRATARLIRGDKTRQARRRAQRRARMRLYPLRNQVLYESYYGAGALCNPRAIFDELVSDPAYRHMQHVWALKAGKMASAFVRANSDRANVRFVVYGSKEYEREMYRSKYLVNNSTLPAHFTKRAGQIILNTWHGTPLKRMGYHVEDGASAAANTLRNFLMSDYLLSPNPHTTEEMYLSGYRLEGLFVGKIIETGYPRVDLAIALQASGDRARAWLSDYGVTAPQGARLVLVAPTWKGDWEAGPRDDAEQVADFVSTLQSQLGDQYFVIVKMHQVVTKYARKIPALAGRLVSVSAPTNGVLAAVDALVTDYSSIYFDYLPLDRPIAFYAPDASEYSSSRGTYFPPSDLPGPVVETVDSVADYVRSSLDAGVDAYAQRRAGARERFCPYEDGDATRRVVAVVFGGRSSVDVGRIVTVAPSSKRVLIHIGGMKPNGITTSALNLLGELDYEDLDVTVWFSRPRSSEQLATASNVDPRARVLHTLPGRAEPWFTARFHRSRARVLPGSSRRTPSVARLRRTFGAEWRRIFGDASFDEVVDFSGYSPRPAALLLASPAAERSIWLHNDIAQDRLRDVNGERPHFASLSQTVLLYRLYDNLVSVSASLSDVNRESWASIAGDARFTYAHNVIDSGGVLAKGDTSNEELIATEIEGADPETLDARRAALFHAEPDQVFATVGRLSTEKNQLRLIRAFDEVSRDFPQSRLVIVGGGPLLERLIEEVVARGLEDRVHLVGRTENPFIYLRKSGCFVLSSDYEGQPMVILEARVLGLPIVATAFSSVSSAVEPGTGLVVEQSDSALAEGLRAYLRHEVPSATFDPDGYNAAALEEFYSAIGAT